MKRFAAVFCTALLVLLCGCQSTPADDISFFYCRPPDQYQYFEQTGVIRTESRDLTSHRNDLRYMIGLYLAGPLEENLQVPFTKSTRLINVEHQYDSIRVELSDHADILSDSEFTLSCACLSLTCIHFTGCKDVTVVCGERSITMTADQILLYDTLPQQETTGG